MRAVVIRDGDLVWQEEPDATPGTQELLVEVRAAGLNGADMLQRKGLYPPPPGVRADVPGMELAGTVVSIGADVTSFGVGDSVMAVVAGAAQAELAVVQERTAIRVPGELSWEEAGGFPEVFTTAHDALFTQCALQMGERLLVHGAAGGVGSAAVQLGVACGASVVGSVRDPRLRGAVGALGALAVAPDDAEGPFDVILELVGGINMARNLDLLAPGGRIAVIGVGAGARAEINLLALMGKRARIHGSTLRSRPLEQKADAARRVEAHVLPLLASGRVRVPVAAAFPMSQAGAAYDRFVAGSKFGKIILTN